VSENTSISCYSVLLNLHKGIIHYTKDIQPTGNFMKHLFSRVTALSWVTVEGSNLTLL